MRLCLRAERCKTVCSGITVPTPRNTVCQGLCVQHLVTLQERCEALPRRLQSTDAAGSRAPHGPMAAEQGWRQHSKPRQPANCPLQLAHTTCSWSHCVARCSDCAGPDSAKSSEYRPIECCLFMGAPFAPRSAALLAACAKSALTGLTAATTASLPSSGEDCVMTGCVNAQHSDGQHRARPSGCRVPGGSGPQ